MNRRVALVLICILPTPFFAADDKEPPKPHVRLKFDGTDKDEGIGGAKVTLKNTSFKDKALVINGLYPNGPMGAQASTMKIETPKLSYDAFTVAARFKADEFGPNGGPVIVGGPAYRWFRLGRSKGGNVEIGLNQSDTMFEAKKVPLATGKWVAVACSVSVKDKKVILFVDGKKADEFELPNDFAFRVATSNFKDSDKVWTTVNYSNGATFKGQIDELIIYDTPLNADQLAKAPLKP